MTNYFKNALIGGKLTDIEITDGKFTGFGKFEDGFDLKGLKVYPGLIDIHTHGCMGFDASDGENLDKICKFMAKNGVTSFLPTTMTIDTKKLAEIFSADFEKSGAEILGYHAEGPYININKKGAQNGEFVKNPDLDEFKSFENVKMITVAPELEGSEEFIKNCGCVVSIGHTDADYETVCNAAEWGAKCLTHTFNAMNGIHHREPGPIGAALEKDMYIQVICDGLHIHKSIINLLYKAFGSEKMIIISDSMRACGLPDGIYDLGGQNVTVKNKTAYLDENTLAGSCSTLLDCVKKCVEFGICEQDAFKMASQTPAELLNLNKGQLKVGFDADFIALDENLNLKYTVINGQIFYN